MLCCLEVDQRDPDMLLTATFSSVFLKVNAMPPHIMSELTYKVITSAAILSTGNNLYNLIEHIVNQLDFVRDLGTAKNSQKRFVWILQGFCKEL
jgi:hypothetical protein